MKVKGLKLLNLLNLRNFSHHGYKLQLQGFYLDWVVLFCLGIQTPLVKGLSEYQMSCKWVQIMVELIVATIRRSPPHLGMGDLLFPPPLVRGGRGGGEGVWGGARGRGGRGGERQRRRDRGGRGIAPAHHALFNLLTRKWLKQLSNLYAILFIVMVWVCNFLFCSPRF